MRKFIAATAVLALGACTTAQLQTEATRLAAINTIICKADQSVPMLVSLGSSVAVAVDPAVTPGVIAADAVDAAAHKALQDACPVGSSLLAAVEAGQDPATVLSAVSAASTTTTVADIQATVAAVEAAK